MLTCEMWENVNIEKNAEFAYSVELGDNSGLGINCRISGKTLIGNNVMMGPNVCIFTTNHAFDRTDIPMNEQGMSVQRPVVIEDDVWIGANVIILPGVTISKGSIVGAGAVVTKNVPEYAIVGGNPATVIKYRKNIKNSGVNNTYLFSLPIFIVLSRQCVSIRTKN